MSSLKQQGLNQSLGSGNGKKRAESVNWENRSN